MPTPKGGRDGGDGRYRSPTAPGQGALAEGSGRRDQCVQPGLSHGSRKWVDTHEYPHNQQHAVGGNFNDIPLKVYRRGDDLYAECKPVSATAASSQTTVVCCNWRARGRSGDTAQERNASTLDIVNQVKQIMPDSGKRCWRTWKTICCSTGRCCTAIAGVDRKHHRRAAHRRDGSRVSGSRRSTPIMAVGFRWRFCRRS